MIIKFASADIVSIRDLTFVELTWRVVPDQRMHTVLDGEHCFLVAREEQPFKKGAGKVSL